ncbi:MAG: hypothetical protein WKG01_23700 [Kofleriaceae bacterium]
MTSSLKRELAMTVLFAGALAADITLTLGVQCLLLLPAMMVVGFVRTWQRDECEPLDQRLGMAITFGFGWAMLAMLVLIVVGLAISVLVIALAAGIAAAIDRARLAGSALPTDGEALGRRTFAGTAHAVGAPEFLPTLDMPVIAWVARQGLRRRWSSGSRFELRDEHRRVLVEPTAAVIREAPLVFERGRVRDALRVLAGVNPARRFRVWSIHEGNTVFVVGETRLEADPSAPTLRDPGRVHVFVGAATVGFGPRRLEIAKASRRIVLAGALAISAGGIAIATALGWM